MTALSPPAERVFLALSLHCYGCPDCKPVWSGDTAIARQCTVADGLAQELRENTKTGDTT